jgi:hypothetical protein
VSSLGNTCHGGGAGSRSQHVRSQLRLYLPAIPAVSSNQHPAFLVFAPQATALTFIMNGQVCTRE